MERQDVEVRAKGLTFPPGPVARPAGSGIIAHVTRGRRSGAVAGHRTSVLARGDGGANRSAIGPAGARYGWLFGRRPRPGLRLTSPQPPGG
jgi:hypothetical protein